MKTSVDIILLCYNQEQYIEQALCSIYAQEPPKNASIRIIVADDASSDNTLSIIKRLAPESPLPMVFLPNESNLGISKNYKRSFAATKADYVAILEGDDYWLPTHLAQHVDFLTKHPECSMSMNEITFLHEKKQRLSSGTTIWKEAEAEYILIDTNRQITRGNQLGNLSACVFRGPYLRELPGDLFDMATADWMLGIMMTQYGNIAILKESSSVYRYKQDGVWAGQTNWQRHIMMLRNANMYDRFLRGKYHSEWRQFKRRCWYDVRHNWMHYMPLWLQNIWHKWKRIKIK